MEYEHKEFIIRWPSKRLRQRSMPIEIARDFFWQEGRSDIMKELSAYLVKGWEPVGQPGPEGIEFETITDVNRIREPILKQTDIRVVPKTYRIWLRRPKK